MKQKQNPDQEWDETGHINKTGKIECHATKYKGKSNNAINDENHREHEYSLITEKSNRKRYGTPVKYNGKEIKRTVLKSKIEMDRQNLMDMTWLLSLFYHFLSRHSSSVVCCLKHVVKLRVSIVCNLAVLLTVIIVS